MGSKEAAARQGRVGIHATEAHTINPNGRCKPMTTSPEQLNDISSTLATGESSARLLTNLISAAAANSLTPCRTPCACQICAKHIPCSTNKLTVSSTTHQRGVTGPASQQGHCTQHRNCVVKLRLNRECSARNCRGTLCMCSPTAHTLDVIIAG